VNDLNHYYAALHRLVVNKPIRVPINSKINNDTVALEAGRKRGTIKKSRASFSNLILEINNASQTVTNSFTSSKSHLKQLKYDISEYKEKYHQSLNREIMLLNRVAELEKELNKLSNVTPFRK